jgi:hypothetical protein
LQVAHDDAQAAVQHTLAATRRNLSVAKSTTIRAQQPVHSIQTAHVKTSVECECSSNFFIFFSSKT